MTLDTPVAFIVFNRPEHTARSFARLRDQRPSRLFVIADGPRPGHPTDVERVREVREIVAAVDWPCEVHRDYAEDNLGCKRRVSTGLDGVFAQVERAIVLEDDCIPNDDFFRLCDLLLERYADDDRVAAVTGDNFQGGRPRGDGSYYFSKYPHVWGWATWRRAWQHYDREMTFWDSLRGSPRWAELHPDVVERRYWEAIFDRAARGLIDTWDYAWTASVWRTGGLTATPNANLVTNIGFGPDATHTVGDQPEGLPDAEPLGPIAHPPSVRVDAEADRYTFEHHYGGAALRMRRRPLGFLRWTLGRVLRRGRQVWRASADERAGPRR